jgi:hypothetical protein
MGGHHLHHPSAIGQALDTLNTNTRQPEQICRSVGHTPWSFFLA